MKIPYITIISIAVLAIIISVYVFLLIQNQPTKSESTKYAFEGDYAISSDMKTTFNNKPFFVSKADPSYYNGAMTPSNCVYFSMPQSGGPTDPSGFIQTNVYFPDGIKENLTTGYGGHPPNPITVLTKHENPQAGITRYTNGSVNLLVSDDNQTDLQSQESPNVTTLIIPDGLENPDSGKNFVPHVMNVTIGVNNTVRWTNEGDIPIAIMANQDDCYSLFVGTGHYLDSGSAINKGESYNYTFTKAGKFRYISQWPWANGWVQVSP